MILNTYKVLNRHEESCIFELKKIYCYFVVFCCHSESMYELINDVTNSKIIVMIINHVDNVQYSNMWFDIIAGLVILIYFVKMINIIF